MDFSREISRLLKGVLVAFLVAGIAASYWALTGEESLLLRDDNPRRVEEEETLRRGSLYDRSDTLLAESIPQPDGRVQREFHYPAMNSTLGYFSLRYGAGGIEAAFNAILRGDTLAKSLNSHFEQDVLHRPQHGSDVRLTLSLEVQQALAEAMGNRTGAAVILSVPDGEIIALVSQPTYDPATLDSEWDALVAAPGKPFFNRALQGVYQPGGMLQTPLMAAVLLRNDSLETIVPDATLPVQSGELELNCAAVPSSGAFNLKTAYAYGCPRPFLVLAETLGEKTVADIITTFRLSQPPVPAGFPAQTALPTAEATPEVTPEAVPTTWLDNALGQGNQTINPLGMAGIAAAIINNGNAPQPYFLQSVRAPASTTWQNMHEGLPSAPLITADAARQLGELMKSNLAAGAASAALREPLEMGGHAAIAYSGDSSQVWFIGFVRYNGSRGAAIAVVLENTSDPAEAAAIGGTGLEAVYRVLNPQGEID